VTLALFGRFAARPLSRYAGSPSLGAVYVAD
jgi:hypothetical protein